MCGPSSVITYVLNEQISQVICKEKSFETLFLYSKQQNIFSFQRKNTLYISAKYVSAKQTDRVLGYIHWIHPPQKGIQWRVPVNTVMHLWAY